MSEDKKTFSEDMDKFFKDNKISYDGICFDVLRDAHFDTEAVALYRYNESVVKNVKRIYYLNKCLSRLKENENKNDDGRARDIIKRKKEELNIYISLSKSALSAIRSKISSLRHGFRPGNYESLEEAIIADSCDIVLLDNLYEYSILRKEPDIAKRVKLAGAYVSAYKRSDDCKKVLDVVLNLYPNDPIENIIYTINELDDEVLKECTDISLKLIEKMNIGAIYTLFATRAPLHIAGNKKKKYYQLG